MRLKRSYLVFFLVLMVCLLLAAKQPSVTTIRLKPQQRVSVVCSGDALIVHTYGEQQIEVICRDWVYRFDE